jgi:UDP-apiose/xylose synthase
MYVSSPLEVFELNFDVNLGIARLCIKHHKRLIQYSSAEVYGKAGADTACREEETDSIFGPVTKSRWIYATAKLLLERVLHAYGEAGDLEYTIVRPFNFIGTRIDYLVPAGATGGPRVFPHFMSALLTRGPIRLVNGGSVHRAFLHIDDANDAFQTLLDHPNETRNRVFNIGNPANNLTIRELAFVMIDLYRELTGEEPASRVEEIDGEEFYGVGYEDGDRLPPDISRIRALGWEPHFDLRTTFADVMRDYLAQADRLVFTRRWRWRQRYRDRECRCALRRRRFRDIGEGAGDTCRPFRTTRRRLHRSIACVKRTRPRTIARRAQIGPSTIPKSPSCDTSAIGASGLR